jgi:alpha-glucosidase
MCMAQCNPNNLRDDCGHVGTQQDQCEAAGCCWSPISPNPSNLPYCFFSNAVVPGYAASDVLPTSYGWTGQLSLLGAGAPSQAYGPDIGELRFDVYFETSERLRMRIVDPTEIRYEIPQNVLPRDTYSQASPTQLYTFGYVSSPFSWWVVRTSDGLTLFNTTVPSSSSSTFNGLIYKDQYLELSAALPESAAVYGLGESTKSDGLALDRNRHTYTLWNRDTASAATNQNLYGSHPFYLAMVRGMAHGVVMMNSNGMDIVIGETSLTYRMIGGIVDVYVLVGGAKPDMVVQQYTELVGRPFLPPVWSLGFHQCRYGYHDVAELQGVVANYSAASIPLETMWSDIDYMNAYRDFTLSPANYPQPAMHAFVSQLRANGQHYVVILDPGIEVLPNANYEPYEQLIGKNLAVLDSSGSPFQGCVWPGPTNFPSFVNPASQDYWQAQLESFVALLNVSDWRGGTWIDMNEISNAFCNGACAASQCHPPGSGRRRDNLIGDGGSDERVSVRRLRGSSSSFNPVSPPYAINNGGNRDPLNVKTLDMDCVHPGTNELEYNVHNLYGLAEAIATHQSLLAIHKNAEGRSFRPFVLSRSTFMGSGRWTAHWGGDNSSQWPDMWWSILNMLNFNIYGVPMVGSDICGFNDNTTPELCARWIALGAFYPFSRDHSSIDTTYQELYRWPSVAQVGRKALNARYALISYYYTLMYKAHVSGSTVARPLFFEFPRDAKTLGVDQQFMVGSGLLVTPVLQEGATNVQGYFPGGATFYSLFNYTDTIVSANGQTVSLPTPIDAINVHLRSGTIVPMQQPKMTVAATRATPFTIVVPLDSSRQASGQLYLDDGELVDSIVDDFALIAYAASAGTLKNSINTGARATVAKSISLGQIHLLGMSHQPSAFHFNGVPLSSSVIVFDAPTIALVDVSRFNATMLSSFTLTWQ